MQFAIQIVSIPDKKTVLLFQNEERKCLNYVKDKNCVFPVIVFPNNHKITNK